MMSYRFGAYRVSLTLLVVSAVFGTILFQNLGYLFGVGSPYIIFWPVSGFIVAFFCLTDRRSWMLVGCSLLMGKGIINFFLVFDTWVVSTLLGALSVLQGVLAAWLIHRFSGWARAIPFRVVVSYVVAGAFVAPTLSSAVGVTSLWLVESDTGLFPSERYAGWTNVQFIEFYQSWWTSDALGFLLVFPALMALLRSQVSELLDALRESPLELLTISGLTLASAGLVFGFPAAPTIAPFTPFLILPLFTIAAIRLPPLWNPTLLMIAGLMISYMTARKLGPFSLIEDDLTRTFAMQVYLAVIVASNYLLSALVSQRQDAMIRLSEAHQDLITKKQELNEAVQAATAAAETKSRFLSTMGHELRTPLNGIIGFILLLRDRLAHLAKSAAGSEGPDKEITEYVEIIDRSSRQLLQLINDVLDLSRARAHAVTLMPETCDLRQLITDVTALLSPLFEENNNRFDVIFSAGEAPVRADPARLRQVLFNILGNATKFTKNGDIHLTVDRVGAADGTTHVFKITDTGIGMREDVIAHIFDQFSQADDSVTREYGGTGLGLAITHELVDLMDGRIEVASDPGKGTTVTISLPLPAAT